MMGDQVISTSDMDNHLNPLDTDSDDEYDWEEVDVPEIQPQTIEITLNAQPKTDPEKRKKGISHAERLIRIDCHKLHTLSLLANAWVRNKWLNDELLHARLLSVCPLKLQSSFAMIHKSRIPDQNQRGRMFENAMRDLTDWWSGSFEIVPDGHLRNRTFHDVEKILERYRLLSNDDNSLNAEMDLEVLQDVLDEDGEFIRSPKSLMKRVLIMRGSRDTSAQLFTALCRSLGIPARLVASLQSVPWQASIGKPRPKYKKNKNKNKGKDSTPDSTSQASEHGQSEDEDDMEEVDVLSASSSTYNAQGKGKATDFPGNGQRLDGGSTSKNMKGKEKAKPRIKLRKARPKGRRLGSPSPISDASLPPSDPTITPPVFWTEVFSKPDGRWLPVDPIRCIVNKRKVFDPTPLSINPPLNAAVAQFSRFNSPVPNKKASRPHFKEENRLIYVLAFEEDGYARDVTRRYAREFSTKVSKVQGGSGAPNMGNGGKGRITWWNHVLSLVYRPYRLHRDDVEDEELETAQMLEGMPTTVGGFKDHPIYVLTRHLKQNETIHPPPPSTPELGKFRGEPVYPRSAVVSLKTAENWMRNEGRTVKAGEQPLKMVKVRAGTVNKLRELEVLKEAGTSGEGGPPGDAMQGLYARSQTEPYVPEPVINGIVPKNNFGNIDLYTPSMLPHGATHIPYKGAAKIARKLGFDFAEAVTGFEFKKRRAFPVIEGIVVAKENEEALLEAFWESERLAEEKARVKREERVIKQWTRLIQGLRIRQRLQEQYGRKTDQMHEDKTTHKVKPSMLKEDKGSSADQGDLQTEAEMNARAQIETEKEMPGHTDCGFVVGADDVVQAFHLPKFQYVPEAPVVFLHPRSKFTAVSSDKSTPTQAKMELEEESTSDAPDFMTYDLDDEDNTPANALDDNDTSMGGGPSHPSAIIPKTMAQFAEDAAVQQAKSDSSSGSARSSPPRQHSRPRQSEQAGDELADGLPGSGTHEGVNARIVLAKKSDLGNGVGAPGPFNNVVEASSEAMQPEQNREASAKGTRRKNGPPARSKSKLSHTTDVSKTKPTRRSARTSGRKRARIDLSDNDDSDMASASCGDGEDDDEYSEGARASKELPMPKKRGRTSAAPSKNGSSTSSPSAAATKGRGTHNVPTSTRTLRPRTSKNIIQTG